MCEFQLCLMAVCLLYVVSTGTSVFCHLRGWGTGLNEARQSVRGPWWKLGLCVCGLSLCVRLSPTASHCGPFPWREGRPPPLCVPYNSHRVPMGLVHDGTETPRDWYTTGAEVGRVGTEASTVVLQSHEPQWVLWTQKLRSTLLRTLS